MNTTYFQFKVLILLIIIHKCISVKSQCPQIPPGFDDRYHWYTILEKCYFFYPYPSVTDRNKNYTESRELCQSLGGKMYEPKDLKTNDGINENIANSFWMSGSNYWIGINDMSMENVWKYDSDNTNVIWKKWSPSGCNYSSHCYCNSCEHDDPGPQPNNYLGKQNCVAMRWNPQMHDDELDFGYSTWYDENCSVSMATVCEYGEKISTTILPKTTTKDQNATTTSMTTLSSPKPSTTSFHIQERASSSLITWIAIISVVILCLGALLILKYKQKFCFEKGLHKEYPIEYYIQQSISNVSNDKSNDETSEVSEAMEIELTNVPLEVNIEKSLISKGKLIGSGNFGDVHEGILLELKSKPFQRKVALKYYLNSLDLMKFYKEVLTTSHLKHENIVEFIGVCVEDHVFVLELMEGGQLLDYLRSVGHTLRKIDLVSMIHDVVQGCAYLEQMKFVHRNIAARNCLLTSRNPYAQKVKLGDLGLARDIGIKNYYKGEDDMPINWMSPESLNDQKFTSKSDVWAFGVLIWEIITLGQKPFEGKSMADVLHLICYERLHLEIPKNCHPMLADLMVQCWRYHPFQRPSFDELNFTINEIQLPDCQLFHYPFDWDEPNTKVLISVGLKVSHYSQVSYQKH